MWTEKSIPFKILGYLESQLKSMMWRVALMASFHRLQLDAQMTVHKHDVLLGELTKKDAHRFANRTEHRHEANWAVQIEVLCSLPDVAMYTKPA